MPPATVVVLLICAACALLAVAVARPLRRVVGKDRTAALAFLLPGAAQVVPAAWLAADHRAWAAVPLLTIGALCLTAGAAFLPTASSRFAEFERQFWAHVHR